MDTKVRTPLEIFNLPQHLVVPLFQRPYVWDEDEQWLPLWQDIERIASLRLREPYSTGVHFLGAVVLQAHEGATGVVQAANVIDGQQRLTTLQIILDATAAAYEERGFHRLAKQLSSMTHNGADFVPDPADQLKLRHTNDDRAAYDEVMNAEPPIEYGTLRYGASKIARAHAFFVEQIHGWLLTEIDQSTIEDRAETLATVLKQGLQLVVIDLRASENSQEIFETLNARGTPLTAADLVKNFVFQRLDAEGADTEKVYKEVWPFRTRFWDADVPVGRESMTRSSVFLNQWLVSRTAEPVSTKQTFTLFKHYVEHLSNQKMSELLATIRLQADLYEQWTLAADDPDRPLTAAEMCVYRLRAMGTEVLKPVLIWLHEPGRDLPQRVIDGVVTAMESWLVRRLLLRLPLAGASRLIADVIRVHRSTPVDDLEASVSGYLSRLRVLSTYWPGDVEVRRSLQSENAYKRFSRGRLRMILEALEDDLRSTHKVGCVSRRGYPIEHLMPQAWKSHWPVEGLAAEIERNEHVHRLGNLTLLTDSLNSAVSNGPWFGSDGKREKLATYDVLLLNRDVRAAGADGWDETHIDERTDRLIDAIERIWPVPAAHIGEVDDAKPEEEAWVEVRHLIAADLLRPGTALTARPGKFGGASATITAEGAVIVDDTKFESLSAAARHVRGGMTNGWMFWHLPDGRRVADVREAYRGHATAPGATMLKPWSPETDVGDATTYWNGLTAEARNLFGHLIDRSPDPISAPELASLIGVDVHSVAGLLAWPGRAARSMGRQLPSRWIDGLPSRYWMDESTAELFSSVRSAVDADESSTERA